MKRILSLILLLLGGLGISQAAFYTRIPYQNVAGKMQVKVSVGGVEGTFIFDTGAPVCLTHSFAQKVNLTKIQEMKFVDSNGQEFTQDLYMLDALKVSDTEFTKVHALKVSDTEFTKVQAVVFEEGNMIEQMGIDGVLGYTLFGSHIVELDAANQEIIISDMEERFPLKAEYASRMLSADYTPMIEWKVGGVVADTVLFDSGAAGFWDVSETKYMQLKKQGLVEQLSRGEGIISFGAAGLEESTVRYRLKAGEVGIGAARFRNVTAETTTGMSRVGTDLLYYGKVVMDYRKRLFYFIPNQPDAVPDMYRKTWNVEITVMGDYLTAGFIWESAAKDLSGGERIVAVNGKRFDKVDMYEAMTTNLVNLTGDEATITVLDKQTGKERDVKIHLE